MSELVAPAKAGVQKLRAGQFWIPAFAGITTLL
jgi:hypothetical protein